jgi:uncharacterized protein (DUF736 family)
MEKYIEIGALWNRQDVKGSKYISGKITLEGKEYSLIVRHNLNKTSERQPDYRIILNVEKTAEKQQ